MDTNAHALGETGQYYYAANMQPMNGVFTQIPGPAYYSTQPFVIPVAQSPVVFIANTAPTVYPGLYTASQTTINDSRSSAGPLRTSTPVKCSVCSSMGTCRHLQKDDHHVSHAVLAEISKISLNDNTVELSPEFRVPQPRRFPPNYKTKMCSNMAATGFCRLGQKCLFAHKIEEQRVIEKHPRFKTRLCKHYETSDFLRGGECPYGERCEFIHPWDEEFRHLPRSVQAQVLTLMRPSRNDITPDMPGDCPSLPRTTRSAVKVEPSNSLANSRNIAGSMMCLNSHRDPNAYLASRRVYPARSVMGLNNVPKRRSIYTAGSSMKRTNSLAQL